MNKPLPSIGLPACGVLAGAGLIVFPHSAVALLATLAVIFACLIVDHAGRTSRLTFLALLLIAVPAAGLRNSFLFELGIQVGICAALALGLNIVVGMAGLLDLGYAGFFAIGAYTWAIFGSPQAGNFIPGHAFPLPGWPWFYVFAGVAVVLAALAGFFIGLPALRLRGDYLAVVTLGLGQVVRLLANNLDHPVNITNGPQGITPIEQPPVGWLIATLDAAGLHLPPPLGYALFLYVLVLLVAGTVILIGNRLDHSRFGRAWVAIREDEIAARSLGISLMRTKILAFATGAAFAGVMGAIFAAKQRFVSPESFTFLQSVTILVMVLLGGMGSVRGAILGAAAVTLLNIEVLKNLSDFLNGLRQTHFILNLGFCHYDVANLPSQLEPAKYERMVFGVIIILMMIFRPGGLIPETRHRREREDRP